jgi:hypothetical protein
VIANRVACDSINYSNIVAQLSILGDINLGGNPGSMQRGDLKILRSCKLKVLALLLDSRMRVKLLNTDSDIIAVFAHHLSKHVYQAWYHCWVKCTSLDCRAVHTG